MRKGLLFTISGPSGVGKGSICKGLMDTMPDLVLSISCTTRPPRGAEVHGREYFFIDEAEFSAMAERGAFLEHAGVFGKRYGTPREHVEQKLAEGRDVILEIDVQGGLQVLEARPDTIGIFVLPPSFDALYARLVGRSTEGPEQLALRLGKAADEMQCAWKYRYALINDELDRAVDDLAAIIRAERHRVDVCGDVIESIYQSFRR